MKIDMKIDENIIPPILSIMITALFILISMMFIENRDTFHLISGIVMGVLVAGIGFMLNLLDKIK